MTLAEISSLESGEPVPLTWRNKLISRSYSFHVKSGQMIIAQDTTTTDVYFISYGKVQFSLVSRNGRETILRDMGGGYIFGELSALDSLPRSVNVTAVEDCKLARLSGGDFKKFLEENPVAGRWMNQQLANRVRSLTEKTFQLSTMSVSSRIQNELVRMIQEAGNENDQTDLYDFPTHAKMAAKLGTHREAITKELRLLSSEGILQQSGRKVKIFSVSKLKLLLSRTLQ